MKVFNNRVLRRVFGPEREEMAGGCRRLHIDFHKLYTSNIIQMIKSRKLRLDGACSMYERDEKCIQYFG